MQQQQRRIVWWLAALAAMGAAAAAFVQGGYYNVAATVSHTQPVYWLLEYAMQQSVRRRARHIDTPPLDRPAMQARGAACYREHCITCHGAPGVPPSPLGLSMQPLPGSLVAAAAHWRPHEIYWITRHGLKLTGMPAWQHRMADDDLWAVAAFVSDLPRQTPQQAKQRLSTLARCPPPNGAQLTGTPDPRRGRHVLPQYGCHGCHVIEGVVGSNVHVGPPLRNLARRDTLPGGRPNTLEHLVQWLRDPQAIDAHTAMPSLGVTQQDALDMAAYLQTLR